MLNETLWYDGSGKTPAMREMENETAADTVVPASIAANLAHVRSKKKPKFECPAGLCRTTNPEDCPHWGYED